MKTEIGETKVLKNSILGRIIGFSDKGSLAIQNNEKEVSSIVIFCTPYGTEIETGRFYLRDTNKKELEKIYAFEKECKNKYNKQPYNNKIKI